MKTIWKDIFEFIIVVAVAAAMIMAYHLHEAMSIV